MDNNDNEIKENAFESEVVFAADTVEKKVKAFKKKKGSQDIDMVDAEKSKINEFFHIDRNGNAVTNFFENYKRRYNDPVRFKLFLVPISKIESALEEIDRYLKGELDKLPATLKEFTTNTINKTKEVFMENENNPIAQTGQQGTTEPKELKFNVNDIDWESMRAYGITKENLESRKLLEPLLKGQRPYEMVPITVKTDHAVLHFDSRLNLEKTEDGKVVFRMHGKKHNLDLHRSYQGVQFTDEDKQCLRKTGNLGRVVNITNRKTGEDIPSLISVDRLTNSLVHVPASFSKAPEHISGRMLTPEEKTALEQGKPVTITGIPGNGGGTYDLTLQYNADLKAFKAPYPVNGLRIENSRAQNQQDYTTFRNRKFTVEEQERLQKGEVLFVKDLYSEKKDTFYEGYVWINKENGRFNFDFNNPNSHKVSQGTPPVANNANPSITQTTPSTEQKQGTEIANTNAQETILTTGTTEKPNTSPTESSNNSESPDVSTKDKHIPDNDHKNKVGKEQKGQNGNDKTQKPSSKPKKQRM